ncbi:MAG: hypothetical protein B5M48_04360 [Candidatus Omnitrophica bacterium 4484_213]|nr:MAG: hypothetical protein B5M48_04360 [Candidatus Omnitrophica bacterium 4484_213]
MKMRNEKLRDKTERKLFHCSIVLLLFLSSVFCLLSSVAFADLPFRKGETVSYRVQWKGIHIGSAKLIFGDEIILQTHTLNFKDIERIKGDADYYPLEVSRDIRLFGRSIQILEKYDQKKRSVEILRKTAGRTSRQVISSDAKIHHPILLIYYFRSQELKLGESWMINLPLAGKYKMEVTKLEKIKTPVGKYLAYRIESFPSEIKFWISADERRLPLKIEKNDSFFTHSSFVMTGFK